MPRIHLFDIVADLRPLRFFVNSVSQPKPGSIMDNSLKQGAETLLDWYKQRYLAGGNGEWAPNARATTKRKEKAGANTSVLFEFGDLFAELKMWRESDFEGYNVGYQEGIQHTSGIDKWAFKGTVAELARIHSEGLYYSWTGERGPAREILPDPPGYIRQRIVDFVRAGVSAATAEANRQRARTRRGR